MMTELENLFLLQNFLKIKKAITNPQNDDDDYCFLYCIANSFHEKRIHLERITSQLRDEIKNFNTKGMKFPVEMRDIDIFERNNKGISVHVFGWDNGRVYIHRKAKIKINHHVYLLMLTNQGKKHFCLVKSLTRLLRKGHQRNQRFYCDNCLNCRFTDKAFEEHKTFCEKQNPCETFPPAKKEFMKFEHTKYQTAIPFRIYADSEAILKPINDQGHGKFQEHIPSGFCFYTVDESVEKFSPILTRGENCVDEFLDKLIDHVRKLQNKPEKPIIWNEEEEKNSRVKRIVGFAMEK